MPALRSAGLALARTARGEMLLEDLLGRRSKNTQVEAGQPPTFDAEDLVRGYRVDVLDADAPGGALVLAPRAHRRPRGAAARERRAADQVPDQGRGLREGVGGLVRAGRPSVAVRRSLPARDRRSAGKAGACRCRGRASASSSRRATRRRSIATIRRRPIRRSSPCCRPRRRRCRGFGSAITTASAPGPSTSRGTAARSTPRISSRTSRRSRRRSARTSASNRSPRPRCCAATATPKASRSSTSSSAPISGRRRPRTRPGPTSSMRSRRPARSMPTPRTPSDISPPRSPRS